LPETGGPLATQLAVAKVSDPEFWGNVRNSTDISKGFFQSGMCEFESSEVSQPVRRLEILPSAMPEMPAMAAFANWLAVSRLRILALWRRKCRKSPAGCRIIPVFGRPQPETGFDLHCVAELGAQVANFPQWPPANWECRPAIARRALTLVHHLQEHD
jgi:hypothetical protein